MENVVHLIKKGFFSGGGPIGVFLSSWENKFQHPLDIKTFISAICLVIL
jgi:hypothetical protein